MYMPYLTKDEIERRERRRKKEEVKQKREKEREEKRVKLKRNIRIIKAEDQGNGRKKLESKEEKK